MTTSTNTARTRRSTAKAPDGTAPADAAAESLDAAGPRPKPTKPPAKAGPAPTAPAVAAAPGTGRKPTKPPAKAGPATTAPADATAGRTGRKPTKPPAKAGPATTAPADATAGRTRRKPKKPSSVPGPATTAADAATAGAEATVRSVADPSPVTRPWGAATGLRLVDRIGRGVTESPTEPVPASQATPASAAPQADAAPPAVAPRQAPDHDRREVTAAPEPAAPAIGATEARLFDCPSCSRPLTRGTSRCPGCGVRLVGGVALRRVGTVAAAGIAVCLVVGGGLAAAAMAVGSQRSTPAAVSNPSSVPATPTATPTRSIVVPPIGPPAGALAALSGTAVLNARITADADSLAKSLARKGATTIEIARAIRSLAADAALGIDLTGKLAQWPDAAAVRAQLDDLYRAIAQSARVALRASLTDAAGYRRSGARMLAVLDGLGGVDAASRTLAATVGLELPPVPPTVP